VNSFLDLVSNVASYGATASLVWAAVYLLTHANDPRSLLGGWRYNRDLETYFYRGVELDMDPKDAWKWALEQVQSKWTSPPEPTARDPGEPPELT